MDCPKVSLDSIEVQMSTVVSHDTKSVPKLPTNIRLSNSEVFSAMRAGNKSFLEKMKSCITPMESYKDNKGDSILHVAASFGRLELVESIVSQCPSLLLEKNCKHRTPLHVAARAGHSEVVQVLAASMECPYVVKDINGDTPLHLALMDLDEKTEILEKKRIIMQGEFVLNKYMYPLCSSIYKYFSPSPSLMETVSWLVNANRHVSFLANKDGISPLYLAVKAGNLSLIKAMLSRSAVNSIHGESSRLASQLEGRKSLVHVALKAKNINVLDVILDEEPGLVDEKDEEDRTCISVGASVGFYKGLRKVLDISTSGVFECDKDGSFPIHKAVEKGHLEVVKELLKFCPDSVEQVNKEGQNVLHIAAKSGKAPLLFLMNHIRHLRTRNHLIKEQDVDGNTPLHLATINWRPQAVDRLTRFDPYQINMLDSLYQDGLKPLDIQNKAGLRPLDIAQINLHHDYILRERMTLMVLLCIYKPKGVYWIPTSGMTLKSISDQPVGGDAKFKDRINNLLLVAALVATVTFAAGFTMPGGFNSDGPYKGIAILVDKPTLAYFLVYDTLAMQSSLVAIVALVWAQLGDQELAHKAFNLALPSLFFALFCMSMAFYFGVLSAIQTNSSLSTMIIIISQTLTLVMIFLLGPYVIPQLHGIPFIEFLSRVYLYCFLMLVNEDDEEKLYISDSGEYGCLKRFVSFFI